MLESIQDMDEQIGLQAAFESTRSSLVSRPWAVDDLDRILQQWQHKQYMKALLFVDNAGSDVILGEYSMSSTSHTSFTQPIHNTGYILQRRSCQMLACVCYMDTGIVKARVALLGMHYMLAVCEFLYCGRVLMQCCMICQTTEQSMT